MTGNDRRALRRMDWNSGPNEDRNSIVLWASLEGFPQALKSMEYLCVFYIKGLFHHR